MGREVRRVPRGWRHPKKKGHYVPLHEEFPYNAAEVAEGLRDGWLKGKPPHYNIGVMPSWPAKKRTHWQMYETCTEGTPISPVMATPEELAAWLAAHGASAFGSWRETYDEWLATSKSGSAPSMIFTPETGVISGVEGMKKFDRQSGDA